MGDPTFDRERRTGRIFGTLPNVVRALQSPEFCGYVFRAGPGGQPRVATADGSTDFHWLDLVLVTQLRFRLVERGFLSVPKTHVRDAARLVAFTTPTARRPITVEGLLDPEDFSDLA